MEVIRKIFIAMMALAFAPSTNNTGLASASGQKSDTQIPTPAQDFTPPHIFPAKELYVVKEGDTALVSINVIFPSLSGGCIETVEYEALSPPDFIMVTPTFRREFKSPAEDNLFTHQMALLVLSPKKGDAGEYEVRIKEKLCPQSEGGILIFKIRVKSPNHSRKIKIGRL